MKKRTWFLLSLFIAAVMIFTGCGGDDTTTQTSQPTSGTTTAPPAETVELTLAHAWATTHLVHVELQKWVDEVYEATDGRVDITIYSGGALAGAVELYDALATGVADMAWFLQGYTPTFIHPVGNG